MQDMRIVLGHLSGLDGGGNIARLDLPGKQRIPGNVVQYLRILFALVHQLLRPSASRRKVAPIGFNLHLHQQCILVAIQQLQPFVAKDKGFAIPAQPHECLCIRQKGPPGFRLLLEQRRRDLLELCEVVLYRVAFRQSHQDVCLLAFPGSVLARLFQQRHTLRGGGLGTDKNLCRGQFHLASIGGLPLGPEAREDRPSERVVATLQMQVFAQPVEQHFGAGKVAGSYPVQHLKRN